ncbi:hypothetical protein [Hathewaya massiliensis]|uniref:hypothetical protein n=1 Tax=Hathewaya massiliensis TaxID=1964382 RepID=UPI00115AFA54|nr:hypothetical protein [Hathewaya massiliensis]
MNILKCKNNYRYYYKDDYLYFVNDSIKFRLNMSVEQYQEVCKVLDILHEGASNEYVEENLKEFNNLIELLKKVGIAYEIESSLLEISKDKVYFSIAENLSKDVNEDLKRLMDSNIIINKSFIACEEISKILATSQLNFIISENSENDLEISFKDGSKEVVNTFETNFNEIMLVPILLKNVQYLFKSKLTKENISPKILAQFSFYSLIEAAINNITKHNFIIKQDLEVKRKKIYTLNEKKLPIDQEKSKQLKQTKDSYALNSLELFLSGVTSKIISFNRNIDYGWYQQAPIQVFTIQYYSVDNTLDNCYIADISYERLCNFIAEIGFMNVLKNSYGKEYMLKLQGEFVNDTILNNFDNEIVEFDLKILQDYHTIIDLFAQKNLDVTLYKQYLNNTKYCIYISNKTEGSTYRFNVPLKDTKYVDLVIYTYISALDNNVDLSETFFSKINFEKDKKLMKQYSLENNHIDKEETTGSWKKSSLGLLLEEYGFKYEVWEI